jgi:hypothetical protein
MRRGDRAREIEVLRQHYRDHRDQLMKMISEAPSEHLATEYQRLVRDIDGSLGKLDELEGRGAAPAAARDPLLNQKTEPGTRQLVTPPPPPPPAREYETAPASAGSNSRTLFMVGAAVLAIAIIGFLVWRAARDRRVERPIVSETTAADTAASSTATAPPPIAPAPGTTSSAPAAAGAALSVAPAVADYGTIRKGTRAVRQLEVTNTTSQPITYTVARSQCRCLYYDYTGKLAPKKKETLTVTVDAAKAKAGNLAETVEITSKQNASVNASFQVNAVVK